MKKYKIRTTQDMLNAVTPDNIDGFLKDFSLWLRITVIAKQLHGEALVDSSFTWNDDGEYGEVKSIQYEFTNAQQSSESTTGEKHE